jgi:hypothetical protein
MMATLKRFLLRLVSFFRSNQAEADLAREIDSHLALRLHDVKPMDEVAATLWHVLHRLTTHPRNRHPRRLHVRQIVVVIFARAFAQVVFGIGAGGAVVLVLTKLIIGLSPPSAVAAIGAYMALMLLVCLLACILPSGERSAWNPAEALRVDGLDGTGDQ